MGRTLACLARGLILTLAGLPPMGCALIFPIEDLGPGADGDSDADADTDGDSDADADADGDSDADSDADGDADACVQPPCDPDTEVCWNGDCVGKEQDADGDHYTVEVDCDDGDPNINPGLPQVCYTNCGEGEQWCQNRQWSECSAPASCDCEEDLVEDCGWCGSQTRFCENGVFGVTTVCEDQGSCAAGTEELRTAEIGDGCDDSCWNVRRVCSDACEWGNWRCEPMDPDIDRDGFLRSGCEGSTEPDCDDNNPRVNPGATEIVEWVTEEIDGYVEGTERGRFVSLAFDPAGNPHVSYIVLEADGEATDLWYASRGDNGWEHDYVRAATSSKTSMVVDANVVPHIAYSHRNGLGNESAYVTHFDGLRWEPVSVRDGSDTDVTLLLHSGELHLVSRDPVGSGASVLNYSHGTPIVGNWSDEPIFPDGQGFVVFEPAMAISAEGEIWVAYREDVTGSQTIQVTTQVFGNWEPEEVTNSGYVPSLAFDSQSDLHLVFVTHAGDLMHVLRTGGEWVDESVVDVGAEITGGTPMAADAEGGLHVAYLKNPALHYAYRSSGGDFSTEPLDVADDVSYPSLAIDTVHGRVGIAYYNEGSSDLHFVTRSIADGMDNDCDGEEF